MYLCAVLAVLIVIAKKTRTSNCYLHHMYYYGTNITFYSHYIYVYIQNSEYYIDIRVILRV